MPHPLRWFLPGVVFETTIRTIQERFLLRPSAESRDLILGILGRAQMLYPDVDLYAFVYLSNHSHLLVSSSDGEQLASFLGFVNGNVAREMGRLYDWAGPLWGRRHRPIPILDDDALVERLQHLVAQGVKEGLVESPLEWPGASCVAGLVGEMVMHGVWRDRTRETRERRRTGELSAPDRFATKYVVRLTPIPPWAHLSPSELSARHLSIVRDIERHHRDERMGNVLGSEAVQAQDAHDRPSSSKRSPAPPCHASTSRLRNAFRVLYATFVSSFRAAAQSLRRNESVGEAAFPPASFPPRLPYVRPSKWMGPPWSLAAEISC